MIYTVTFNPSIDYIVNVDNFMTGVVNRTSKEIIFPGGKGINVSMVLKNLGQESTALGFMAGFTGDAITRLLQEKGVTADFIHVTEGLSRINVKLRATPKFYVDTGQSFGNMNKICGNTFLLKKPCDGISGKSCHKSKCCAFLTEIFQYH